MRINQFIASASGLSRRQADTAVTTGRVQINGHIATLGQIIRPTDLVTLDHAHLTPTPDYQYIMLNKPVGYISTRRRQGAEPTLYELLPTHLQNLRLAGRLDRDSSGLILLSNDGAFLHHNTHPSRGKTKRYELTLSKPLAPSQLIELEAGIILRDGPSYVHVISHSGRNLIVTIGEGRNRQLRRTFGKLGYRVEQLHRIAVGSYKLANLASGSWKKIRPPRSLE